jgi:putative tricarboxylic transport membrane protein
MIDGLLHGVSSLMSFQGLGFLLIGAAVGTLLGIIPGLSLVTVLTFVLALIYHIDLTATLCLFLGIQAGMYYSASATSILVNAPAHPEAFAVTFDGYPMARKGQPGRALGISAASTCVGAVIGAVVLLFAFQGINSLPGLFHPPDFLALVTLAMILVGSFGTDSALKVLVSMGAGLMIAAVGPSPFNGEERFTLGWISLSSGVSLVAVMLGMVAVPQMLMVFGTGSSTTRQDMTGAETGDTEAVDMKESLGWQTLHGVRETFRHWNTLLLGGVMGVLTGIIPGMGGFAANFLAYGAAKQTSRRSRQFGTGIPEGIIAPEASSIAKEAGSIIPILGLGIPGNVGGALFIAALAVKGVKGGYGFTSAYPLIPYQIVWIILIAGVMGTAIGVLIGPQIARVTRVPGPLIVPFVLALAVVAPYFTSGQFIDVIEVALFALVGLALRRLRYPVASFVLGLVLGPTFETNVYLTHTIYPGFSFVEKRPLADAIFAIAIAVVVIKVVGTLRRRHRHRAPVSPPATGRIVPAVRAEAGPVSARYPVLAVITSVVLLAVAIFAIAFSITHYQLNSYLMPVIGGLLVAVPVFCGLLPRDVYALIRRVRDHPEPPAVTAASVGSEGAVPLFDGPDPGPAALTGPGGRRPAGLRIADTPTSGVLLTNAEPEQERADPVPAQERYPAIRERSWASNGEYRRELTALLLLFMLVGLSWVIGFFWAIVAFMVVYGLTCTQRHFSGLRGRLIFMAISTVAMALTAYVMFHLIGLSFSPTFST